MAFPKQLRRNRTTNKYGNRKVQLTPGGRWYDSKLEADYRRVLDLMVAAGEISDLVEQPQTYLTDAQIAYRPDFCFTDEATGEKVFVECKGLETRDYLLKLKLWMVYGPGPLWIVKRERKDAVPSIVRKVIPKMINPSGQPPAGE
ncbi:MAG: DUF1064 domain-containing protein [Dehalococcoidia bacterium]|jgi:hypothetical protein